MTRVTAQPHHSREAPPSATFIARAVLAVFALGVPLDVLPLSAAEGARSGESILAALGLALAAATAWQVVRTGRIRRPSVTLVLLAGFTAWAGMSFLWAADSDAAERRIRTLAQLLGFVWLAWQIARSKRDLHWMAGGYVIGCSAVALLAWRAFMAGEQYRESDQRYAATGFDPNDMGVTLAIGIPVAVYLALDAKRRWGRLWMAYLPLSLSAIALSGSRGSVITASIAVVSALWLTLRRSVVTATVVMGVLAAIAVAGWSIVPENTWARIFTLGEQLGGGGKLGNRVPIWRAGLDFLARHPFAGAGVGNFGHVTSPDLGVNIVAHNTFLSVAVELGCVGAVLFLGVVVSILFCALRRATEYQAIVVALLLTWTMGVASLTWEHRKTTWFVFLLGAALCSVRPGESGGRDDGVGAEPRTAA